MKKRTMICLMTGGFIVAMILMLGSCLPPDAGGTLLVDNEGHFFEDIVYKDNYSGGNKVLVTFSKTGSYESTTEYYESEGNDSDGDGNTGEGWVKTGGERGTYSWDPATYILTLTQTEYIVTGGWEDYDDERTVTEPIYFTEHKYYYVYQKDDTNKNLYTYSYNETSDSYLKETQVEMEIDPETKTFAETASSEEEDENGNLTSGSEIEIEGAFEILPEERTFAAGNTVTLTGEFDYELRTYVPAVESWSDWTESKYALSMDLIHMGNFLLSDSTYGSSLQTIGNTLRNLD